MKLNKNNNHNHQSIFTQEYQESHIPSKFIWSKVLYKAQIISSKALIVPVKTIYKPSNKYSHIEIRKKYESNTIIQDGLSFGFLKKTKNRIITKFLPIHSQKIFLQDISLQLKQNNINNSIMIHKK